MIDIVRNDIHRIADRLHWLPPLMARLTIAGIFIEAGWGKLHHLDKVTHFFASLGIPAPQIQAPMVACFEFSCGCLILLGLFTRLAALPLIATMVVAILTAKLKEISSYSDLFAMSEYLYIVLLIWLAVEGAGKVSLDYLWASTHRQV